MAEHTLYPEYDHMLDDVYGMVKIGACEYSASEVLKAVDHIAYEIGYADFVDSLEEESDDA